MHLADWLKCVCVWGGGGLLPTLTDKLLKKINSENASGKSTEARDEQILKNKRCNSIQPLQR